MNKAETILTWDLLKDLGFQPDDEHHHKWGPVLSFDFGNYKLSAFCGMAKRGFAEVVVLDGVWANRRTISLSLDEMPLCVTSREQGIAWIVWCLDKEAPGKVFHPEHWVEWLAEGRQHRYLLPWEVDMASYNARPHCNVQRNWMRLALKNLAKLLVNTDDTTVVEFSFDGSVLQIRCFGEVVAMSASGKAWGTQFFIPAGKLRRLPKRLTQDHVEVSVHKGQLHIGPSSFEGAREKLS